VDGFRVGFETSYASHRCIRTLGTYSHRRRVLRPPSRAPGPEEPRRTPWPRCTDSLLFMIGGKLPKPSTQFEFSLRWWNRGGELSCRDGIGISSRRRDGSTREASQENICRPARLGVGTSVRAMCVSCTFWRGQDPYYGVFVEPKSGLKSGGKSGHGDATPHSIVTPHASDS
jgi:hypothetical protein